MERYSDLLIESEMGESEEVVIAIVRDERNQDQQGAANQGYGGLAISRGGLGARLWLNDFQASHSIKTF